MLVELTPVDSLGGVHLQHPLEQILGLPTHLRRVLGVRELEIPPMIPFDHSFQIIDPLGREGQPIVEKLVENHPDRPDITFIGIGGLLVHKYFWGHIERSAKSSIRHKRAFFGEAKVSNDESALMKEEISQLEVPMHDAVFVELVEPGKHLLEQEDCFALRGGAVDFEVVFEVSALAVVGDHVVVVGGLEQVVQVEDVGVGDDPHDFQLGVEQAEQQL